MQQNYVVCTPMIKMNFKKMHKDKVVFSCMDICIIRISEEEQMAALRGLEHRSGTAGAVCYSCFSVNLTVSSSQVQLPVAQIYRLLCSSCLCF